MTDELSEWVFEGVLQYLKSPLWTAPVFGFVEKHCSEFVAGEEENKLIYTELHNQFRTLVDELLSSFLEQLGVSPELFVEAIKSGANPELSSLVSEFLFALDDFPSFRALMEKKNIELELEAMHEYAKYHAGGGGGAGDDDDMTDEERFLYEMAIRMSLGENDIAMKHVEQQDAELLQALALSLAIEQERLMYEQLLAEQEGEEEERAPASAPPSQLPTRSVEQIQAEVHQQRLANVERALQEINHGQSTTISSSNSGSEEAKKIVEKSLAPLAEKRSGVFGSKGSALPSIRPTLGSASSASMTTPAPAPSFSELKQQAEAKLGVPSAPTDESSGPSQAELEQRAAYFKAHREKLLHQKAQSRAQELAEYQQQQQLPPASTSAAGGVPTGASNESDATKEMRLALARRFKEDLLQETRKAAGTS